MAAATARPSAINPAKRRGRTMQFNYILGALPDLLWAMTVSVKLAAAGVVFAFLWGVILLAGRLSRFAVVRMTVGQIVDFARYTPVLLQLFVLYFGLPMFGIYLSAFACGVATLAFQQGAYLSEVFRGGLSSIDKHQRESAAALGMTQRRIFLDVLLPQALIKSLPVIGNQVILLFKDTTIVSAIGIAEVTLTAKLLAERSGASFMLFLAVAVLFICATTLLSLAVHWLEGIRKKRYGI